MSISPVNVYARENIWGSFSVKKSCVSWHFEKLRQQEKCN
jgi:hypothetical protein